MQRVIPQNERNRAAGRHRWRPQDVSDVSRYGVAYRCDLRASADDWSVADKSAPAVFPEVRLASCLVAR